MKIGILGTSNSILKSGWMPVFQAISSPKYQVINFSAGANPSAYGLYALDHFDLLSSVDYLILDFAVNDQNFLDRGALTFESLQSYFFHLVKRVSESKVRPLVLIFFNESYLYQDEFPIKKMQIGICEHFNVSYLDIQGAVKSVVNGGEEDGSIFLDNAHLSSEYSKQIALCVKSYIDQSMDNIEFNKGSNSSKRLDEYRGFSLNQLGDYSTVKRATSLASYDCVRIGENGIRINFFENCIIEGIFFRASKENSYITIESNGVSLAKNVSLPYRKGFFFRAIRPDCIVDGITEIYPFKKDNAIVCDENWCGRNLNDEPVSEIDIVGILLRKKGLNKIEYDDDVLPKKSIDNGIYRNLTMKLRTALMGNIEGIDCHELLYVCSTEMSDICLSILAIEKAIEIYPYNAHYFGRYAELLERKGDVEAAIVACNRGIEVDSSIAGLHMQLSHMYDRLGDNEKAVRKAGDAISLKEDNPNFYFHFGNLLEKASDLENSKDLLEKAIGLDPSMQDAYQQLSRIYAKLGDTEQAILMIQKAIEFNNDNPRFYYRLGNLLKDKGDLEGTKSAYEKALDLDPSMASVYQQLSRIYAKLGDTEKAIIKIREAIEVKGNNPYFYHHLGSLLRTKGDLEGAKVAQEKAIDLDPTVAGFHMQMSHICNQIGEVEQAISKVYDAVVVQDNNPYFYRHLGTLLKKKGDLEGAEAAQRKALALKPA